MNFDIDLYPFPPIENASKEGIVAVGGDLSPTRLVSAYSRGIFPWFSDDEPIMWWSPDPRFVLFPEKLKISKSMRTLLNKGTFHVTYDSCFRNVIEACSKAPRKDQDGTWITNEMIDAYCKLHEQGIAHSVEVWENKNLVGGLYGVSLGSSFFGESMFSNVSNASKFGFIKLVNRLIENNFELIDCQVFTEHLKSLGAEDINRNDFLNILEGTLEKKSWTGNWGIRKPTSRD